MVSSWEAARTERSFHAGQGLGPAASSGAVLTNGVGGEPPSRPSAYWDDPHFRPRFDNSTDRNVTAQLGKSAFLHCRIRQLGDRTVSNISRNMQTCHESGEMRPAAEFLRPERIWHDSLVKCARHVLAGLFVVAALVGVYRCTFRGCGGKGLDTLPR